MKLIEIAPEQYINVGTGAVSRVYLSEGYSEGPTPTVVMNTGFELRVTGSTLAQVITFLQSHEQDYEGN